MSDSLWPYGLCSPFNSPGQNTGVNSFSLLQGILPTQGSNPGLPHWGWILYRLSHLMVLWQKRKNGVSGSHPALFTSVRTTKPHVTPKPRLLLEVSLVTSESGAAAGTLAQECPLPSLLEHHWLKLVTCPHTSLRLRKRKSVIRGWKATHMDWETLVMNTPLR